MATQIPDGVEILSDNSKIIITLDGDRGIIILKNQAGNEILRLGDNKMSMGVGHPPQVVSTGSFITMKSSDGQVRFQVTARNGQIYLGGNGASGDFQIFKEADNTLTDQPSVRLDGHEATLRMGGNQTDGDIILRRMNGENVICLDGGRADIHLGGNQRDGSLMIYPSTGDNQTADQTTIYLDGHEANLRMGGNQTDGDIILRRTSGDNSIRLDGGRADIHLGGNQRHGNLMVYPSTGDNQTASQATIQLDGDTGDIILRNADCAEDFDVPENEAIEPGTVVTINGEGRLQQSTQAYDKKVAGVISGAGDCTPGIVLGRQPAQNARLPVALTGKVYCKVDTQYSPIDVGDLLTTSPSPGHAMKASDPSQAFGAVIGKALRSLNEGKGLIPILVALQ
jgi:hypothetical protein